MCVFAIFFIYICTGLDMYLAAEKQYCYYVYIRQLDEEFSILLQSVYTFALEAADASFLRFRNEAKRVIRHTRHVTGCKVQISFDRVPFLEEIENKYALWENNLEYRPLREVIVKCQDEGLVQQLLRYESLLQEKGESIIYDCKRLKEVNNGLYLKLKARHETTLATLMRVQEFLVNDVGLDDATFTGFGDGCIELYFRLSPVTAGIANGFRRLFASRITLIRLGISRVELSGHWVLDTASGRVTYLKVGIGLLNFLLQ